jgi:membrane protein YdbS with pleckstrin-like domain
MIRILFVLFGILAAGLWLMRAWLRSVWALLKKTFPPPEKIVLEALVHGEKVYFEDKPALTAFVIERQEVLLLVAGVAFFIFALVMRWGWTVSLVAFLAVDLLALHLVVQRLGDYYTRYVITNFRVMRVAGIINHNNYSIPWVKVTDFGWEQSLAGRLFGYATIKIESANEESRLKELRDLRQPVAFNEAFVELVFNKQGRVEPPRRKVLYAKLGPEDVSPVDEDELDASE